MLSCLHSLCHKCLDDHITHSGQKGQFQCPACRKSLQIPEDGAYAFPKNFFVNTYMDAHLETDKTRTRSKSGRKLLNGKQMEREHICINYEDGDDCTQPEQFCLDCCEYYCRNCSRVHRKSKLSRSHSQVALDDLTEEMLRDAMSKSVAPRCQKHKNEQLLLYCNTCLCAVCYICSQTSHQSHTFREVGDVDEEAKYEINDLMTTLQGLIQDSKDTNDQIKHKQQKVERSTSTAKGTIKSVFQKVKQTLVKEINQKINKITEDSESQTIVQSKNQTLHTELLESLHTFTDDLLKRGTVYDQLASLPEIRSRIKEFHESPLASADGAIATEIPNSTDLVSKHLDGLVMTQEVKLEGPRSAPALILEIKTTCNIKQQVSKCNEQW